MELTYLGTGDLGPELTELAELLEELADDLEAMGGFLAMIERTLITERAPGNRYEGTDGADEIRGSRDDDVFWSSPGADWIRGGAGEDIIAYRASPAAVDVDLQGARGRGGHAEGDTYTAMEHVIGSQFDDRIAGNGIANRLTGLDGNDTLLGGRGKDSLIGGSHDDVIDGGPDDDRIWGDFGDDSLVGGTGHDTMQGLFGDDTLVGGDGDDVLRPWTGSDDVTGGPGADIVQINDYRGTNVVRDFDPDEGDRIALRGPTPREFLDNLTQVGNDVVLRLDDGFGNVSEWTFLNIFELDFGPTVLV